MASHWVKTIEACEDLATLEATVKIFLDYWKHPLLIGLSYDEAAAELLDANLPEEAHIMRAASRRWDEIVEAMEFV